MKLWMRKLFVTLVAIMTLGLYIPPAQINPEASEKEEVAGPVETTSTVTDAEDREEITLEVLTERAKEQTLAKLGPRIGSKVEDEVLEDIFPEIEAVIGSLVEDDIAMYEISEDPSAGYGERIFNLTQARTGAELARFHVRRDLKPGEGYWFNFHYHVKEDAYETHHPLGEIYWDKNTPPKWMS